MKETTIQSTTNYNQFQSIIANREVNKAHVTRLVNSIRENDLLHINPIIVDNNMKVIDGQHRLEAAKNLKVPIYYIQDNSVNQNDIASLNSNQRNWSAVDYVNYYCVQKVSEYLTLSRFIREYPFVSVTTFLTLLSAKGNRNMHDFKNGRVDISNQQQTIAILNHINDIRNLGIEEAYDRNFILAIRVCWLTGDYEPDVFLEKLEGNRSGLYKCAKKTQYLQLIEQVYNRFAREKVRFY